MESIASIAIPLIILSFGIGIIALLKAFAVMRSLSIKLGLETKGNELTDLKSEKSHAMTRSHGMT